MTSSIAAAEIVLPLFLRDRVEALMGRYADLVGSLKAPIDVPLLAELAGARVIDGNHRIMGLSHLGSSGPTISLGKGSRLIGSSELTTRGRFTLAHEIGHVLLARSGQGDAPAQDLALGTEEALCDKVAEMILMPLQVMNDEFVFRLHAEVTLGTVFGLSRRLDVSFEALSRRLSALDLLGGRWIVGWRYEGSKNGLRRTLFSQWLASDISAHVSFENGPARAGGCALLAFRTDTHCEGEEAIQVWNRLVVSKGEAKPAGRLTVIETLRAVPQGYDFSPDPYKALQASTVGES